MTKTRLQTIGAASIGVLALGASGCMANGADGDGGSTFASGGSAPSGNGGSSSSVGGGTGGGDVSAGGTNSGEGGGPPIIDEDGDGRPDCVPGIYPTSQVPRLKNREYDNTIRDLVGLTGLTESGGDPPSSLLATDQGGELSDLGWSSYKTVAEMVAEQVMGNETMRGEFLECDPATDGCLDSTIVDFGRRAFRRPLTDEEVSLFQGLNDPALTENGTPEEIAELILYGFLVSPMFLMRTETQETTDADGNYVLSSHEIASRLSYTLWGSMPDEELYQAADSGELATKEQILAQAERMLQDDKARLMVADFHRKYLHMEEGSRWDTFVKDEELYPEFSEELREPLIGEVEMFFEQTVFGGGSFQDLLLSTTGFVNAETAALYGMDASGYGAELSQTELPGRPGFLTRVGWLSAYSAAYRTSPIVRGAFITKEILGVDPGAPPPGASEEPLPDDPDLDTNRKRVEAQTSGSSCAGCHQTYINPPGFVFEAYDTIGRPQTTESDTGATIDTTADVLIDGDPVTVSEPESLMEEIANSTDAQYYYAQKWVGYAFDRTPNSQDACLVETLSANIAGGDYRVLDLIADITQADAFTVRAVNSGVAQ